MVSLISQNALRKKKQVDVEDVKITEQPSPEQIEETESILVKPKSKKKREKIHIEEDEEEKEEDGEKKKRKKVHKVDKKRVEEEEKEMKRHESILFGSLYAPSGFEGEDKDHSALFYTDRRNASGVVTVNQEESEDLNDVDDGLDEIREPKWVDEEEEKIHVNIAKQNRLRKLRTEEDEKSILGLEYESRSRAQFAKLNPGTEWAQLGSKWTPDMENEEITASESILRTNEDLVVRSSTKLLPGLLEYSRLVDANIEGTSNGPINSVQFHRNAQLLLTAGLDKGLRFFQIDGKRNAKVGKPLFLEDYPIYKAAFLPDGTQVIVSGRRKFFYTFDMEHTRFDKIGPLVGREEKSYESFEVSPDSKTIAFLGNEGCILLVSTKTKELIGTMKMNGSVRSMAYSSDGNRLITSGGDGHIYHWDLRSRRCFHKGVDEGCIMGTSLGASPNGALFAAGSSSGIVNVYNQEEFLGGKRKPVKSITNLTTKVDFVKFNHDAQILAICSTMQKNSLKLVHVPSFSVFSNWPLPKMTLHHPRCLDFSPGGGFMAMGNAAGKVLLFKLHHYQHA